VNFSGENKDNRDMITASLLPLEHISGAEEFELLLHEPVSASDLLNSLIPPHHFLLSTFDNYRVDERFPAQSAAVDILKQAVASKSAKSFLQRFFQSPNATPGHGVYLDGGFGVGKTHLLAAAFHAFEGRKAYLTFQELMFLVGLQRLDVTLRSLSTYRLLALDEFELDDPANTRIASTLLSGLMANGVDVITTSNTPPGALGRERFSTDDFKRELSALAEKFRNVEVDGEDYRQLHQLSKPTSRSWFKPDDPPAEIDDHILAHHLSLSFEALRSLLASAHPIRIRKAIGQFQSLLVTDLDAFQHPHDALRFVYFIDKVYDCDIRLIVTSLLEPIELFVDMFVIGGDKKKYLRTVSRLVELTHSA
jgi:cell division protein ZapE